jgi:hypothetical protein
VPPEKTVPEGEAGSKGRVGVALLRSKEVFQVTSKRSVSRKPIPSTELRHVFFTTEEVAIIQ